MHVNFLAGGTKGDITADDVQIFFKKSFKNTDRNKIEHDRPGPAQDFSWAGPLRPKIFAGRAGPLRPKISAGPKIYNPAQYKGL